MSKFNTTVTAASSLSVAALITFGGIFFAPKPLTPVSAGPTTPVPVALLQSEKGKVLDGEVNTTIFVVDATSSKVGKQIIETDDPSFTANLANGQYLIKSVPTAASRLTNFNDIDATAAVPPASGCGDRLGCTWIWVNNAVENNTWGIMSAPSATHDVAEFTFSRQSLSTDGTQLPPKSAPTAPTTTPVVRTGSATPRSSTPTPRATPATPTQDIEVLVTEEIDGTDTAVQNVQTVVTYFEPPSQIPATLATATVSAGYANFTTPVASFVVNVIPPAGYTLAFHTHPGLNPSTGPDGFFAVSIGLKRLPAPTPTAQPPVAEPTPPTPQVATPATPSTPVTSVSDDDGSTPTTTPTPAPTSTAPAPAPAPEPTPTTVPAPTTTVPDEPVPSTPPPTTIDEGQIGCDQSNDPELIALLDVDDGVMRWLVNGELRTAVPQDGVVAVIGCELAYERLLAMGFDSTYISLG